MALHGHIFDVVAQNDDGRCEENSQDEQLFSTPWWRDYHGNYLVTVPT